MIFSALWARAAGQRPLAKGSSGRRTQLRGRRSSRRGGLRHRQRTIEDGSKASMEEQAHDLCCGAFTMMYGGGMDELVRGKLPCSEPGACV